jgi:transposase
MDPATIGVDLAKSVFQLALADRHGHVIDRRRLTRRRFERFLATQPPCHLIMETCGTAHHWGRTARGHGHQVTLLPAHYVRPYVRRQKTDRTDADALLDAQRTGRISPVPVKTVAQQELLALHRVRAQWIATRTARINALRGLLQEHGVVLPRGARTAVAAVPTLVEDAHGDGARRDRGAYPRVPTGAAVCQLAGPDAPRTLQRHQAAPGRHHEAG